MGVPDGGLGRGDLVLCSGSLPRATFQERIDAAVAGGFAGVSLWARQIERASALEGLSETRMRGAIAEAGLKVAEVDALIDVLGNPETRERADERELGCHRVAETFGARSITVAESAGAALDVGAAADAFGAICDRAAPLGLLVHLEFWPGSRLDLPTAVACVARAARPNGGLLVDAWHLHRTRGGLAALESAAAVPILAVQLSDGPLAASGDYMDETMHRRRVPGEGEFDLTGLLRALAARGVAAPLGVEVLSDELNRLPAVEVGERLGDAMRALVARTQEAA